MDRGFHWIGVGCYFVHVGWIVDVDEFEFGSVWVGYQWESWCRVLLSDWVAELVFLVVVWHMMIISN